MHRAYAVKHHANKGKIARAADTVRAYRRSARHIGAAQWRYFYENCRFNEYLDIKHIKSVLSERYKQTCQSQVVGILNSFVSNRQNDFMSVIRNSSLGDDAKHRLFIINKLSLWHHRYPFSLVKGRVEINEGDLSMARSIFKHLLKKNRKPSFKKISMHLDAKVAVISAREESKAAGFEYWLKLSTLEKGSPIYIPISGNDYYENIPGKRKNFCQVALTEKNVIGFSFIKDVPSVKDRYVPLTDKISLDLGLVTLFASDRGDLLGRRYFDVHKKYDALITSLAANRQRQGLKPRCRRYDNLVGNLREFMKNEINRVLNRVVDIHMPAEIVVERLNFRNPDLSRRMNRLLSRFGKAAETAKLKSLGEMYGIVITETNPAYSSQECSACGYVDKKNRKSQSVFECRCCNTGIHADVNGARNHLARSSGKAINVYKSKKAVLRVLTERFLSCLERSSQRLHSKAKGLLPGNPYYAGVLAQSKGFL